MILVLLTCAVLCLLFRLCCSVLRDTSSGTRQHPCKVSHELGRIRKKEIPTTNPAGRHTLDFAGSTRVVQFCGLSVLLDRYYY